MLKYALAAMLVLPTFAMAEHPKSFSKAKKLAVKIHKGMETTFYCGCDYAYKGKKLIPVAESCGYEPRKPVTKKGKPNSRATRIEWEHVMPAYWFGHQRQCWQDGGRKACKKDPEFSKMEADLHNLVPAIGELNGDRSNYRFTMLEGEPRKYGKCDFEVNFKAKKAEPAPEVRGDIARIYFYMAEQYGLKLSKQQKKLLKAWDKSDPVSAYEVERNNRIKAVQGNANPYIK
ncbi:DNA-specific endonuclease I [Candidatus Terasakiella magnetica]|uniref:DNA-specific endonuclease I n=1 Tax=Candidatus Terasakiella magnetica TaxID=1867952 RepID=A0A1C3RFA8_9PROT|nr:endonuclease [Candidatus Terasakiella magnetica]SCA55912.1 DNA-specific endonuclease I [Candidatus Terasakiella magnetica]